MGAGRSFCYTAPIMIVDGQKIAAIRYAELKNEVSHLRVKPHLTIFTCAPNFETQRYLALKKRRATEVGVATNIIELPSTLTTDEVVQSIQHALMQTDGVVVQLPLPAHLDAEQIVAAIPPTYDVDGMHYDGTANTMVSPVAAAIAAIAAHYDVLLAGQRVVVVGHGKLVGAPAAGFATNQGARVQVVTADTPIEERTALLQAADILILGAGQPHMITPDLIKEGVIIFDAGTSESHGELQGDADPACADKAALFTPVPGGIGPVTIAMLLSNLVAKVSHL